MALAFARMSSAPRDRDTRLRHWIAIVVASLLIHAVALDALPRWTLDVADEATNEPLRAILLPPASPPAPADRVRTQSPEPSKNARPAHATPPAPRTPRLSRLPEFVPQSLDDAIPRVDVLPQGASARTTPATPTSVPSETPIARTSEPAPPPRPDAPDALAPVSARLTYKVVAVERKNANPIPYYGVGSIDWVANDGRYRSDLVAAVDFLLFKVNVLASHSEGAVTSTGLAPDRYTETPRKRSTVATSFNRDARQSISFSSASATVPLVAGAQDRLSVLFQIGALLRANPNLAIIGGHIDIPVAGVRGEVETWVFETQGIETIEVGAGPLATAHLRRVARPGSNDRTIDIWIAHADGGYPARVVYTEPNGSTIEMTIDKVEATS